MLDGIDKRQLAVTGLSLLIEGFMAVQEARSERLGTPRARPPRSAVEELLAQAGARGTSVEGAVNGLLGHRVDPSATPAPAGDTSLEARLQAMSGRLLAEIDALQRRVADLEARKKALEAQLAQLQAAPSVPDALVVFETQHMAVLAEGAVVVGALERDVAGLEANLAAAAGATC